ncbi:ricin-type beta-trefoil lectin domain protein [Streptomyces sp. NPDC090106]|uniref:ricin-type beta-trefoil lectin domain protein n=1 Tax=Streptomyces sp. NPDC090106 TaxID=3365946 RepID=UPI0038121F52
MSEHTAQQDGTTWTPPPEEVSAVLAYASAFCGKEHAAIDLVREVLSRSAAAQGPAARLTLLADVRRTANVWVRDERAGLLRPGFRSWAGRAADTFGSVDTLRRVEHTSLLLAAFEELPEQSRAALWLCLAERDESALAARLLGTSEEFAVSMADSARARIADSFLRLRAERTADARCVHYGTMLGAIARGTHRETPGDLRRHLDDCRFCAHDYTLLRALTTGDPEELRALLVDQVLVWGGPAYRAARQGPAGPAPAERPAGPVDEEPPAPAPERPAPEWSAPEEPARRRRRPVLAVAVAVVLTALATTATLRFLGEDAETAAADPDPAPSAASSAASPSASQSASTGTAVATVALKNTGTGRCLAAAAGNSFDNTAAPAACDGAATQRWQVVLVDKAERTYELRHVSSTLCLDIAGDRVAGDPMQLRPCAYEQGKDAPYPEDQDFRLRAVDGGFTMVCADNPDIAVGVRSGEIRMLAAAGSGRAIRFALDDDLGAALSR